MSGLEKIIEHIEGSATEAAGKLIESAKAEVERIKAAGKADADAKVDAINKQTELDVSAASKRIESAAEMTEKRMLLAARQEEIEYVLEEALAQLKGQEDGAYFDCIIGMIPRFALAKDGEICFGQKDLDRLPADIESRIAGALNGKGSLKISKKPANIDGGFILDYGDVEENCSFDALVESSREDLADKISQIMFA